MPWAIGLFQHLPESGFNASRRCFDVEQILGNRCISQFFELQSKGLLVSDRAMTDEEKARAYDDLMRASA